MANRFSIPLFKVFMPKTVYESLRQTLASGYIGHGPKVDQFEKLLGKRLNTKKVLAVNSGTSALFLAVKLAGIRPGDEVITTPFTFVATNSAILAAGGKPVWADVEEKTGNLNSRTIETLITPKTRAIMVVHWGGQPADMAEIMAIARKHKLKVIEDCAHAFGATYRGRPVGTIGHYGAFSFQAVKLLGTPDSGLLVVKNSRDFKRARRLRWYGIDRNARGAAWIEQDISEFGYKFTTNDIAAAVGIEQLKFVRRLMQTHQSNASFYNNKLRDVRGVTLFETKTDRKSSCWLYTLKVERRKDFIRRLASRGIEASQVIARNDQYSAMKSSRARLPILARVSEQTVCIPVGWWVTKQDRQFIVDSIKGGW